MSVVSTVVKGFGKIVTGAAAFQRGRTFAQQWTRYRPERAQAEIEQVLAHAIAGGSPLLVKGVLTEFGTQIQDAAEWSVQDEMNQLLWAFKERFRGELDRHGIDRDEFFQQTGSTSIW